jgi:branched-chain amino acid transport system substrate-binding protein
MIRFHIFVISKHNPALLQCKQPIMSNSPLPIILCKTPYQPFALCYALMMIKYRFTRFLTYALATIVLFGNVILFATTSRAEMAIGVLTDLSGKASLLGKQIELGARLAADAHSNENPANELRLEVQDSACDPRQAQKAAVKLLRLNVSVVVGPICSNAMYAAIKVLSPAGITVISPFIRASQIARGRKKHNWLIYTLAGDANSEARAISDLLLKRWQGKAYAIADDGSIYGRGLSDQFRTLAELSGQKPIALANYRPLQSNQISMLRRLAKSGLEALFVGGEAVDIAQIARDVQKLGLDIEIAGGESLSLLPHEDNALSVPQGVLAVMQVEPNSYQAAAGLVSKLQRQGIDSDGGIIPGYALMQIALVAAKSGKTNIKDQSFDTILGAVRFSKDGYASAYPYQLHIWRDGQIKPLDGS